jgi:tetratricopeptide (TPR) repeat protein
MHRESVNDLNKALLIDPKNKKGYFERAARLHSLGQDRLAIADLNKVLELKPKTILALSNRAWYQAILGQIENAIADSTEAISLDPNSPWAYDTRGVSFCLKGMYSQALTDFDKYIQLKSKNIKNGAIYYHRAFAYYNLGKTELAKQDLIRARASNYQLEPCEKKWFRAMLTDL